MKKTIQLFALLLLSMCSYAQANLDSLLNVWSEASNPDTSRLNAMNGICESLVRNQPDSTLVLVNLMLNLAEEKELVKYQGDAMYYQGRAYSYKGDLSKTSTSYSESLELYEEAGYKFGIGRTLSYMAGLLYYRGDYRLAVNTGLQTMAISEEIGSKALSSVVSKVLGAAYLKLGNLVKAVEYYEKGLVLAEEVGDKITMAHNLHAIADVYLARGEDEKAEDYHKQSLKIYEDVGDKMGIADCVVHMAKISLANGDFQTAIDGYLRSIELYEQIGAQGSVGESLMDVGLVYIEMGDYPKALKYLNGANDITVETEFQSFSPGIVLGKGRVYRLQGKYNQAIKWCKRGLEIGEEVNDIQYQLDACECLYKVYKSLRKGNEALAYHERVLILKEGLQSEETAKKLQQMEFAKEILADSLQQEEENLLIQIAFDAEMQKKNKTKNIFLVSGIMILLIAGGLWSRLRYVRRSRATIQKERDRSENLLLNILPAEVAEELKTTGKADARDYDLVSIIFTDFKQFTETSAKLSAAELVRELNYCFEGFDGIMEKYGIEKIKTIGDAYMAAGGLSISTVDSVRNSVKAALEMQKFIIKRKTEQDAKGLLSFEMRAGIHTGPVVAGIVGVKKFQYDVWGDTVNTASRMENSGEVGQVNISQATYAQINDDSYFTFQKREKIAVKGKGEMEMYFVHSS